MKAMVKEVDDGSGGRPLCLPTFLPRSLRCDMGLGKLNQAKGGPPGILDFTEARPPQCHLEFWEGHQL